MELHNWSEPENNPPRAGQPQFDTPTTQPLYLKLREHHRIEDEKILKASRPEHLQ